MEKKLLENHKKKLFQIQFLKIKLKKVFKDHKLNGYCPIKMRLKMILKDY